MSETIVALVFQLVTHIISAGGYAGIIALVTLNSGGIPIPSEIILPFSGYLVYLGRFNLFLVVIAGAVGCNLGSAIAYWIGARGGRPLVERYGNWVLMSRHDLDRMTWFFEKYGSIAVLLGRMLPVVQTFVAFPAGIARMPRLRFHIYTTVGSLIWYCCLAWAGLKLGQKWHTDPRFEQAFHHFHLAVEIFLLLAVAWFLWTHWRNRLRPEAT
ncbi:MAG TPA: DedA family protein [Acidobacteriaceae bacterium]|jgi:membrane protein DedA with SNARE-associated domain|nr:DedA family protein [Acidobacteriaceae bacterium]